MARTTVARRRLFPSDPIGADPPSQGARGRLISGVAPIGTLRVIERSDETLLAALDDEPDAFAELPPPRHGAARLLRASHARPRARRRPVRRDVRRRAGRRASLPARARPGDRLAVRDRAAPVVARAAGR